MGFLNWVHRFADPVRSERVTGELVSAALANNMMSGQPADCVKMCQTTADLWRRRMAEKLDRELVDTPLPAEIKGTALIIDDNLKHGELVFEVQCKGEKISSRLFDLTQAD